MQLTKFGIVAHGIVYILVKILQISSPLLAGLTAVNILSLGPTTLIF